jgi:hypothetical protein
MWEDYIKIYFLVDLLLFLFYVSLWVCIVDWTASTTSAQGDNLNGVRENHDNCYARGKYTFAAKELRQSRCGRRLAYWASLWNCVDATSIVLVYVHSISTIVGGGVGTGNVPLAVVTTLLSQ